MDNTPIRNEARPDPKASEKTITIVKSTADIQRLKLEKLMKNPDKPAYIPAPKKVWKPKEAPEFVRDVMGSSAGAGSGEFHVYRHIRRREYNRQAYLTREEKREQLDDEYSQKREENKAAAAQATAKRRAKRLRKKKNRQMKKPKTSEIENDKSDRSNDEDVSDQEEKEDDAYERSFIPGAR